MTGKGENILVAGLAALASLAAEFFWLWASLIEVRDDANYIIADMQRVSELNAYAAISAAVAALCLLFPFVHGVRNRDNSG
jgi:hypothetical protein